MAKVYLSQLRYKICHVNKAIFNNLDFMLSLVILLFLLFYFCLFNVDEIHKVCRVCSVYVVVYNLLS